MDYERALELFENVVLKTDLFDGKGMPLLYLLSTYTQLGKTTERRNLLKNFNNYVSKKRLDRSATDKYKLLKHIEKSDHELDIALICAHFESIYGRDRLDELNEKADVYLRPSLEKLANLEVNDKMLLDVQLGRLFIYTTLARRCGDLEYQQVVDNLKNIIQLAPKVKYEHQWGAFANYELAEVYFKNGGDTGVDHDLVAEHLENALNAKSYALEEAFQTRIKKAIRQNMKAKTETEALQLD
jgi:hypothetical protein